MSWVKPPSGLSAIVGISRSLTDSVSVGGSPFESSLQLLGRSVQPRF
jgi:hypothetical protein